MGSGAVIDTVFRKCFDWRGRAARSEYWFWSLLLYIVTIVAVFLVVAPSVNLGTAVGDISFLLKFSIALSRASIFIFLLNFGVSVRRLHDTGRSGWWYGIILLPYVGMLIFLVIATLPSQASRNEWGENPAENAHKRSSGVQVADRANHQAKYETIDAAIAHKLSANTQHSIKKTVSTPSRMPRPVTPVFGKR